MLKLRSDSTTQEIAYANFDYTEAKPPSCSLAD